MQQLNSTSFTEWGVSRSSTRTIECRSAAVGTPTSICIIRQRAKGPRTPPCQNGPGAAGRCQGHRADWSQPLLTPASLRVRRHDTGDKQKYHRSTLTACQPPWLSAPSSSKQASSVATIRRSISLSALSLCYSQL